MAKYLTDNLLPPSHFTDEETGARQGNPSSTDSLQLLPELALGPEARVFLPAMCFEHLLWAGSWGC
jgi:hypothetical protein